jgi:hypothetical protein
MNHIYDKNSEDHSPKNENDCEGTELSLCLMSDLLTTENLPLTSFIVPKYANSHNEQTVNVYSMLVKM